MTTGTIYCFTNKTNNKKYIGQTIQEPQQRFNEHYYRAKVGSEDAFHRALRKYGKENFIVEIIDTASSQGELDEKEIFHIEAYQATKRNYGYNMMFGGSHGPLTEETKKKISKAKKGKKTKRSYISGEQHQCYGMKQSDYQKEMATKANALNWEITFPDGHKEEITNLRKFCRDYNLRDSNLITYGHTKGYKAKKIS